MPLPSLRRNSKSANNRERAAGGSRDGQAPSQHIPNDRRAPSSVYSQPSISEQGGYVNPWAPRMPPFPPSSYKAHTPRAPPAESHRRKERYEEESESSGGTREPPSPRSRHTPVSEYLHERSWVPQTPRPRHEVPMPSAAPPPVPRSASSFREGFSIDSGRFSRKNSRQASISRSSTTSLSDDESIHHYDANAYRKQSLSIATPDWLNRRRSTVTTLPTSQTYAASPTIGTPYAETRTGPPPRVVSTIKTQKVTGTATLLRALSKRHGQDEPTRHTGPRSRPPIYYRPENLKHSRGRKFLHPALEGAPVLATRTKDPAACSEETSWLFLGTLRGPTPSGVRHIDEMMETALAEGKEKHVQRAAKAIRRLVGNSRTTTIEWVDVYVERKWGIKLFDGPER